MKFSMMMKYFQYKGFKNTKIFFCNFIKNKTRPMKTIKRSSLFVAILAVSLITSCKEDTKKSEAVEVTPQENAVKQTTPAATNGIALNPEHGQPGHRCDIKVGEPLNGTPAATNNQSPLINTNSASSGSGNLNPAHGQPGHRCDIKVGDPL